MSLRHAVPRFIQPACARASAVGRGGNVSLFVFMASGDARRLEAQNNEQQGHDMTRKDSGRAERGEYGWLGLFSRVPMGGRSRFSIHGFAVMLAGVLIALGTGCSTVDPRGLPQTAYDSTTIYKLPAADIPVFKKMIRSARRSISVQVDTTPVEKTGINVLNAGVSLNAELQSALDSFGFLRAVTANEDVLQFVVSGYDGTAPRDMPDYILLCRLTHVSSASKDAMVKTAGAATTAGLGTGTLIAAVEGKTSSALGLGGGTVAAGAATATMVPHRVRIKTYFELYDCMEGMTRFSKVIAKEENGVSSPEIPDAIQRLFAIAAGEYMEHVASRIGPVGIVLKTTGNGRYAYISLGQEAGLAQDGCVQFLQRESGEYDDFAVTDYADEEEDGGSGGKLFRKERLPLESVADGTVVKGLTVEPTRAWVEVKNYDDENPRVCRGMAVRLVPSDRHGNFLSRFGL